MSIWLKSSAQMPSGWNVKLTKCQAGKMSRWQDFKLVQCLVDKMPSGQNAKWTKLLAYKISSWQNVQLTKCQVDEMWSRQNA